MATYCISDIHGHYNAFMHLLDEISLTEDDHIYILGDIIDRGPDVASLLIACVELSKNLDNFHFLLGNHEHMAYQYLQQSKSFTNDEEKKHWIEKVHGSEQTIEAIDLLEEEWVENELIPWFGKLLYYDTVEVSGQPWMLVHAGFNPKRYTKKAKKYDDDVYLEHFGMQSLNDLLWIRDEWVFDSKDAPMPVVHGHTPTDYFEDKIELLEQKVGEQVYLSQGGILYYKNKIDIDCGAGQGKNLGCLRLDDFEEFHAKVRKYN